MTFRRLMLVLLPLLSAVFMFFILRYMYLDYEAARLEEMKSPGQKNLDVPEGKETFEIRKGQSHIVSENVRIERKDKEGRTTSIFRSPRVEHKTKSTADVLRPQIQYFTRPSKSHPQGEILTIVADEATVVTVGSLTNLQDIESGVMRGHVVISQDNWSPDDTSDDILMSVSELTFDNKTYQIDAPGAVVMSSYRMDLTARKMRMTLDRQTRKMTTLTFFEDILMTVDSEKQVKMGIVPAEAPSPPAAKPAEPTAATPPAAPPATPAPKAPEKPETAAAKAAPGDAAPKPSTATDPAKPPNAAAKKGVPPGVDAKEAGKDLWRIDVYGEPEVRQSDQRLRCDHLQLYNESAGDAMKPGAAPGIAESADARAGGRPAPAVPPAPPGAVAATKPAGVAAPPAPVAKAPAAPAPTPPPRIEDKPKATPGRTAAENASFLKEGSPGPMYLIAHGPLMMTPVDIEERVAIGDQRNEVVADGRQVVIEDGAMTITGQVVRYNMKKGTGLVDGKSGDVHLDQPDRVSLTGKRLTFDSNQATAEVFGRGELHAKVNTAGLTGAPSPVAGGTEAPAAPAPKPAKESGPLDATWEKGMSLVFYPRKAGAPKPVGAAADKANRADSTEIRQATFRGDAVVQQQGGLLKGNELILSFDPSKEGGKGQAVNRLIGHGDVYVKNEKPAEPPADPPAEGKRPAKDPQFGAFDITCQDLDMEFARDASGATQPRSMKAAGKVAINDPKGKVRAEKLEVVFAKTSKGALDAQFLEAFGDVLIDRNDPNDELHAEGAHIKRDLEKGLLLLEGSPARAKRGPSRIVGPYVQFLQNDGLAIVRGPGELEAPSTTDLRGEKKEKAEPLLMKWKNGMRYEDKRNFAFFDGGASAATGGSRINGEKIWVVFADRPEEETEAAAAKKKAKAAGGEKPAGDADQPGSMDKLFGHKALVRLYAEKDVRTQDVQFEADGTIRHQLELSGENLSYLAADRKAFIRSPGRFRLLSHDRPKPGGPATGGLSPEDVAAHWKGPLPAGYGRTDVTWTDTMAYEGATGNVYFKGDVDALQVGRGLAADTGRTRAKVTDSRVMSPSLQIVFAGKTDEAAPAKPAAVGPMAGPEDRMTVDKLLADGGVRLWMDDRRGTCQRLIYQRAPELARLYRGPDDYARMWQENEAKQQYGEVEAALITFVPSTGRIELRDQREIIMGQ